MESTRPLPNGDIESVTALHVAEGQTQRRIIADASEQHAAKIKKRETIARDKATAIRTIEKLKATLQADGVAAILADIQYDPPADLARQIRKATLKLEPCDAALAQLDSEIAALRSVIETAEGSATQAAFAFSTLTQHGKADGLKAGPMMALLPSLAALAAVDVFRARHATGAMIGVPAGADRPWQGTALIVNLLKGIPQTFRPTGLTLEAIQRAAMKYVNEMETEFFKESNNA